MTKIVCGTGDDMHNLPEEHRSVLFHLLTYPDRNIDVMQESNRDQSRINQDNWRSHPCNTPQNYLTPVSASCRQIRLTKYEDIEATNIIERHEVRNTRGFQLHVYYKKQYQHSFFVQTVVDSNHLEENIVNAGSSSAFTSVLSRSTPPAAQAYW